MKTEKRRFGFLLGAMALAAILVTATESSGQGPLRRAASRLFSGNRATSVQKTRTSVPVAEAAPVCVDGQCSVPTVSILEQPVYSQPVYAAPAMPAPVMAPVLAPSLPVNLSAEEQNGDSFRRSFVRATAKARQSGKISAIQAMRARMASFSPAARERIKEFCVLQMVCSGESSEFLPRTESGAVDVDGIDWDSLADFLERILPLILAFLEALGAFG